MAGRSLLGPATPPMPRRPRRDSGEELPGPMMPRIPGSGKLPLYRGRSRMTSASLLTDAFSRVHEAVHAAVMGLTPEQLSFRPYPAGNSIAWLIWHLTRIQDDHIAGVAETREVWESGEWAQQFGLQAGSRDTGYGNTSEQVAAIVVKSAEVLTAYYDAVHERTIRYVSTLTDDDLPRIVD